MATGSVKKIVKSGGGVIWHARWDGPRRPDGSRNQQRASFKTKVEADDFLRRQLADASTGIVIDRKTRLGEFLTETWLPYYRTRHRPSSFVIREREVRVHILPALGRHKIAALTPVIVQTFYTTLEEKYKPNTVRSIAATLNAALNQAIAWEMLARNPAKGAEKPPPEKREPTVWTPEEFRAFVAKESDPDWFCFWHVLALTGMRVGEAVALRWDDVDFEAGTIRVERTATRLPKDPDNPKVRWSVGPTKTGDTRYVSIPDGLLALLQGVQQRQEGLTKPTHTGVSVKTNARPAIFPFALTPENAGSRHQWVMRRVDLRYARVHDLRHANATVALEAGVPLKVISERLGHANIGITSAVYAHVTRALDRSAAEVIGGVLLGVVNDDGSDCRSPVNHVLHDPDGGSFF